MLKTFKYRIYPTRHQETLLNQTLEECRWLYNELLANRKNTYEETQKGPSLFEQQKLIPQWKKTRISLNSVYSQVMNDVSVRIDLAFQHFFRRVKIGDKPGYPRFKGKGNYHSFTFPQSGFKLNGKKLYLSKIGDISIIIHRPIEGKIKTCTIKKSPTGKWFVYFVCKEVPPKVLPNSDKEIGIDVGLTTFASFSDTNTIQNPRFFKKEEKELVKAQRKLSKEVKGSPERKKRRKTVVRIHERISNKRNNFAHQESRKIVNKYSFIAVEDLNVNKMIEHNTRCMSKSISDASWSLFFTLLFYKAENAGRTIIKVNPAYTSQDCSGCGHRQKLTLSDRIYNCSCCKQSIGRDYNASLNILRLGLQSLGIKPIEPLLRE